MDVQSDATLWHTHTIVTKTKLKTRGPINQFTEIKHDNKWQVNYSIAIRTLGSSLTATNRSTEIVPQKSVRTVAGLHFRFRLNSLSIQQMTNSHFYTINGGNIREKVVL